MNNKLFRKVPLDGLTKTPEHSGQYNLIKDNWWALTDDDCVLYYNEHSRQCNSDKRIAEMIVKGKDYPASKVVFLPEVWEKI